MGHAPALEEDLGLANIALDLIGQARLLLTYAGEVEGRGRGEDEIAFLREHGEYLNAVLVEQPNGDFGRTIVRQVLIDAFQLELYERMTTSADERLAAIAAKAVKEIQYHLRYSGWMVPYLMRQRLRPLLLDGYRHTAPKPGLSCQGQHWHLPK